jgi:hypothetical protein
MLKLVLLSVLPCSADSSITAVSSAQKHLATMTAMLLHDNDCYGATAALQSAVGYYVFL